MTKRTGNIIEISILTMVFLVVNLMSQVWQKPITLNDGQGWDGVTYFQLAEQLANGQLPSAEGPYVYRIGTPLIVSTFFQDDLFRGFKIVNLIANILTVFLLSIWLRQDIHNWKTRVLLVTLFIVTWNGPVRFVYYYRAYTDPWLFVSLITGLIAIRKIQNKDSWGWIFLLSLSSFIGVIFREAAIVVPIAFLFSNNPLGASNKSFHGQTSLGSGKKVRRFSWKLLIPLCFGVLALWTTHLVVTQTDTYSFAQSAFEWAFNKPLLTYLLSWFTTFGPILFIVFFSWRTMFGFLGDNQSLLVFLFLISAFAWIGGTDTERILYWSAPVIYLIAGKLIEENKTLLKSMPIQVLVAVSQMIVARVFWITPDYPNPFPTPPPILTIPGSNFTYLHLLSHYCPRELQVLALFEYFLLGAILLYLLARQKEKVAA